MFTRNKVAIFLVVIFLIGLGWIVYRGRPVMNLANNANSYISPTKDTPIVSDRQNEVNIQSDQENENDDEDGVAQVAAPLTSQPVLAPDKVVSNTPSKTVAQSAPAVVSSGFTMADVAAHNTPSNCWSAINNSVYDLSSWVSRHPGGERTITMLCGIDGSGAFNGRHGGSRSAQAALVLLKIGQLK